MNYDLTLEDQIRECFGRVVYTHKTHECQADIYAKRHKWYKVGQIITTGLTSAMAALGTLWFDKIWLTYATAILSFCSLYVAMYLKNFEPDAKMQEHREAASKLWNFRESYISLLTDLPMITRQEVVERRDTIQTKLAQLYQFAPRTNDKAYNKARKSLKENEDLTFSAEEIDHFLPESLKRSGGRPKLVL